MRFDWYSCTIKDDAVTVLNGLAQSLGATIEDGHAGHGYELGANLRRDDSTICRVLFGGANGHPHVIVSSDDCDEIVPTIRDLWPDEHYVTRMDAAEDINNGKGTFQFLFDLLHAVAECDHPEHAGGDECAPGECRRRRLKISQAGDWLRDPDDPEHTGRTFYVGSEKSAVRVRLYEKGKQLNEEARKQGHPEVHDRYMCRIEVQVRPEKDSRWVAAAGTPEEAYGYAEWTRDLLRRLSAADVERVHIRERRESDLERALGWLVKQYGEHLTTLAGNLGQGEGAAWDKLGNDLHARILRGRAMAAQEASEAA